MAFNSFGKTECLRANARIANSLSSIFSNSNGLKFVELKYLSMSCCAIDSLEIAEDKLNATLSK